MKNWAFIYHQKPHTSLSLWHELEKLLKKKGIDYSGVICDSTKELRNAAYHLAKDGVESIVVIGGDTALGEVVCGVMKAEGVHPKIGLIPNGRVNDFAKFWGWTKEGSAWALEQVLKRHVRRVDVGKCVYVDVEGHERTSFFIDCVNIGLAASIAQIRGKIHHILGYNTISELIGCFMLVFRRKGFPLRFRLPGELCEQKAMTVCVGSAKGYGQTPGAVPYNGLLDISLVKDSKTWKVFRGFYLLIRGRFLAQQNVMVWRTNHVLFEDINEAPVSIDGQVVSHKISSLDISIFPEEIEFIVVREGKRKR